MQFELLVEVEGKTQSVAFSADTHSEAMDMVDKFLADNIFCCPQDKDCDTVQANLSCESEPLCHPAHSG